MPGAIIKAVCSLILGAALLAPSPSPALALGALARPWALAVVVESSAAMDRPWLGTTRTDALEKALELELRSLPLRVRAGMWLSRSDGARALAGPAVARQLKPMSLILPRKGGGRGLGPGIAQAGAWLRSMGGGAMVVVGADGAAMGRAQADAASPGPGVFVHTVVLSGPEDAGGLEHLALMGGGAFFSAERPARVSPTLHTAVVTALSPARLLVLAHDESNHPIELIYGLERRHAKEVRRRGLAGRPAQLMPGVYRLDWPKGANLGTDPPPKLIRVGRDGVTRLWAGGSGRLRVTARDAKGQPLAWKLTVVRPRDGRVLAEKKKAPLSLAVPAGEYLVRSLHPPLSWPLEVGAGKQVELIAGPPGRLLVTLTGPGGKLRVPFLVDDLLGARPAGTGYTGQKMRLLPGRYRLRVQTVPPMARELTMAPGASEQLELPAVGGVLLKTAGGAGRYLLLGKNGRELGEGAAGVVLPVAAGEYTLAMPGARKAPVKVSAGQVTKVAPPKASAR